MMFIVKGINIFYGKLHIIWDLSMQIGDESVGLFGPNGAGKTTLINAILGLVKPTSGEITFEGDTLISLKTHERIRRRIAVVPQERELFPFMTVLENLRTGAAYIPEAREKGQERLEFLFDIFPFLKKRLKQFAGTLSGGEQRMLAIARALMADPKLLILDEPSSGLQPSIVSELFHRLKEIKSDVSILIAEQNVRQCLKAIDRGYVIENGRIIMEDDAENLADNDHVRRSYLGL
jgi:branched-chain amino acid transport system ATP-binding protein